MSETVRWLPDGSGIGANSLQGGTIVQVEYGDIMSIEDYLGRQSRPAIVRVYADITPPKPDPRVEVVTRALASKYGSDAWEAWAEDAREILTALDAMGTE